MRAATWRVVLTIGALLAPGALPHAGGDALFNNEAVARGVSYSVASHGGYAYSFGHGLAFVDLNGDYAPDLVTLASSSWSVGVFQNNGAGSFIDRSSSLPAVDRASGVSAADYDADGDLDLFISCWCANNRLFRNDGAWTFTEVTTDAGLDDLGAGAGSTWGDVNNDGWLDLYLANRSETDCQAGSAPSNPNRLYLNQGDGTFLEVAAALGVADGDARSFAPLLFDYDRDFDADLFLAEDKGVQAGCAAWHNKLWRNDGGLALVEVSQAVGTAGCMNAMCATPGDLDHNGYLDIYVTNTSEGNELYMNQGDGTFIEAATAAGVTVNTIGWGSVFADFDNDADLELYVCNAIAANSLFESTGTWPMPAMADPGAAADTGQSYCVASADIDKDGDVDMALSNNGAPIRLLVNASPAGNHWIKVRVLGEWPNLFAVGAIVRVRIGSVWQTQQIVAGSAYKAQHDLTLHFGLGSATVVDEIEIHWPDGDARVLTGAGVDTTHVIDRPCLGDCDLDADCDVLDFAVFAGAFGSPAAPGDQADLNRDGTVDVFDFAAFVSDFGCSP